MKYWWDKLKVVDTNLKLWDNLQALWFDACGFMLIGKWDDTYWTKWDPLTTTTTICPDVSDCPNCQPKIKTVLELNWRPEPCSSGDWFVMMTKNKTLKVICKDEFKCEDKLVWADPTDEKPWTLIDKLTVCDESWPLSINLLNKSSWHQVCIGWDPSKADINFTDLWDTPNSHKKWVVVDTWSWIDIVPPTTCSTWRYSYFVYDKEKLAYTHLCSEQSYASWIFEWWACTIPAHEENVRIFFTNWTWEIKWEDHRFSWKGKLRSTDDIELWTWDTLFTITKPWIYAISCNITVRNETEAWLQSIRWGIYLSSWWVWTEFTDAKFDGRAYSKYVNDFRPEEPEDREWSERNLELSIMSFDVTETVEVRERLWIWAWIRYSTNLHDHRMEWMPELPAINIKACDWGSNEWSKTRITCVRIWDVPPTLKDRN